MGSSYHPIYSGLWKDEDLEGTSFETKAFFVFLCSNDHVHVSGIYRVTDPQLVADTGLTLARVRGALEELETRHRIVRDGVWLFVRGYFARQPKHQNLLAAAARAVAECSSSAVLQAWGERYPIHSQWSADRLATVGQRSGNGRATVERKPSSEQLQFQRSYSYRAEQAPSTNGRTEPEAARPTAAATARPRPGSSADPQERRNGFHIPDEICRALSRSPRLGGVARLREDATWWQAQVLAFEGVDLARSVLKAESWLASNPRKAARKRDLVAFLRNWFKGDEEG